MSIAARPRTSSLPASIWWLATGWTLASTADSFLVFVLLWIAEPQGWSGPQTALLVIAMRLPTLAGGVLGGRAVDRFGPVPMMLVDGLTRTVLMAGLIVVGRNGQLNIWAVLVLGAAAGTTAPLSYAAARTLVPRLVPANVLGRANAVLSIGDQLPLLFGAVLTGPALALFGAGRAFILPLLMMLAVAVIAMNLRHTPRAPATTVLQQREPLRTWRSTRVVGLVGLSVAYHFTYGPYETVLPHFVREQLGSGLGGYTLLWTLFGAGALFTLPAAAMLSRHRPGVANALGAALWGALMFPLAFVGNLPIAAVGFALSGAVWGPYSAIETTALQRWTDPADHGRIFGTQRAFLAMAAPLGAAVGAIATGHVSPTVILAASSAGCFVAGLSALTSPSLRRSS